MSKFQILNPFTLDSDAHALFHGLKCEDESLTKQADAQQADINYIVAQFGLTQELPYGNEVPEFADYSDYPTDYHSAINFVKDADNLFMQYPADVRTRFKNDAGLFLDFLTNPDNRDEATKLGFIDTPFDTGSTEPKSDGVTPPAQGDA